MAVLYTPHFVQFFDNNGEVLSGGKLYTYAAGTTTPKASYTTADGDVENDNPVILDAYGRATVFIDGSYKFILKDSNDVTIETADNVTSFNVSSENTEGFFESLSGDGEETNFTLSENLGNDENSLMVFTEFEAVTNGNFDSDTGWTKGSGWTITGGEAVATGAISTDLEQTSAITLVEGKVYVVTYTITQSAGSITLSVGGTDGTSRSSSDTYTEEIIAGSTQVIAFTGSSFTGTVDSVTIREVGGLIITPPSKYTLSGDSLVFSTPPASGNNNILIYAPYTLINAAGAAQTAADSAIAAQAAAEAAVDAVAYKFDYDDTVTMADPGTGNYRLNNATVSSVTAVAFSDQSSVSGNPDVSDAIAAWDASSNTTKGQLKLTKSGTPATFATFDVTGVTDNADWLQVDVTYVDGNGTLTAADECYFQFTQAGDIGDTGVAGVVSATSGVQADTSAGASLISSGSNDCLSWGAGGGANLTLNANMSGASAYKLVNMIDPTSAQDYATKAYVDTEVAGAGGGAMEILGSYTASNATSVDIGSGLDIDITIDDTYDVYEVHCVGMRPSNSGQSLRARLKPVGGSFVDSLVYQSEAGGADSNIYVAGVDGIDTGTAGQCGNYILRLYKPADSSVFTGISGVGVVQKSTSNVIGVKGGGFKEVAEADDALRLLFISGNISVGAILVYGIKKS